MTNATLFLPGFHLATLRRRPRSAARRLAEEKARIRQHSISEFGDCFGHFIPTKTLENGPDGAFSRRRLFSKENTFWAFFSQVLDADGGCQEVVRKVQALAATRSMPVPSTSTSAYCQARGKLDPTELEKILAHTADELQQHGRSRWWKGRRVVVVDGTGVERWDVELFFRDIKTTMGMDVLRCRTPGLVRKEILVHFIAYNVVRRLIVDAAASVECAPRRISFNASIQALRQWEPQLHQRATDASERRRLLGSLRAAIGARQVTARPVRREPRCLKRRPKPFALLTAHRHQMVETPHRSRYRTKQP